MDKNFKKQIVNDSNSLDELALKICGYGHFDHPNNDREYPVKREYIREYLEIGMMYGMLKVVPTYDIKD